MIGQSLAHYRITAKLGEGGMGEVYRATDTKLSREVAIKILPSDVAQDPDRLARFEREARTLAALNHPNIAAIYGVEHAGLIMELVEGPTLQESLQAGPLPVDEAIRLARQIADALEAAHEKNIIHRDLKPANIKVTPGGQVKLLDFGLAKAIESDPAASSINPANSPTLTQHMSQAGVILGTAAYMSPEQARGGVVDKRADIWSFGVVLYEMLTGKRLFDGETISDTLAGVLKSEINLSRLPGTTPSYLRQLLTRCLERDRKKRLHDIGDAVWEDQAPAAVAPVRSVPRWVPVLVVAVAITAGASGWFARRPRPSQFPLRMLALDPVTLTTTEGPLRIAISPNGRHVAYVAQEKLWVRDLDRIEARALEGTDQAEAPFFSPDNSQIAFAAGQELKKVSGAGGLPSTVTRFTGFFRGGTFSADGNTIIFSTTAMGLAEVAATGGEPRVLGASSHGKTGSPSAASYYSPKMVPAASGKRMVVVGRGNRTNQILQIVDLDTGQSRDLRRGAHPVYSATGHLLFRTDGGTPGLWAWSFPPGASEPRGEPFPILNKAADFSAAADGSLIWADYERGYDTHLVFRDRSGRKLADFGPPHQLIGGVNISPDGARAAYHASDRGNIDIWILDLQRGSRSRFTFDSVGELRPIWRPDSGEIVFSAGTLDGSTVMRFQPVDRPGSPANPVTGVDRAKPSSWSPDGSILLFERYDLKTQYDLWTMRRKPDGSFAAPEPYLQSPFVENFARFSPDGAKVAYQSNANGRFEVYIQSFPSGNGRRQVSTTGGTCPVWSADGKQLHFLNGSSLYTASAALDARAADVPVELFRVPGLREAETVTCTFDAHPDGKRFLFAEAVHPEAVKPPLIRYVQNWPMLLRLARPVPPPEENQP